MSDVRTGIVFRSIRRRLGLRQIDVARRARVSASLVSRIERGQLGSIGLARTRRVAEVLEIRLDVVTAWRGGELERVLNSRHASMHEAALAVFEAATGWETASEVSFSIYGERGVIDIVAWHQATRTLLIVELKTELVDPQGLTSTMDRRRRLAHRIVSERGWRPERVGVWVILAETRTNRRHVARHRRLLRGAFPADGHAMRSWLRRPSGSIAALSFLSSPTDSTVRQDARATRRVRARPSTAGDWGWHDETVDGQQAGRRSAAGAVLAPGERSRIADASGSPTDRATPRGRSP